MGHGSRYIVKVLRVDIYNRMVWGIGACANKAKRIGREREREREREIERERGRGGERERERERRSEITW